MSLESIFAQFGLSNYAEPIHRFWPDTQTGAKLTDTNHPATVNEINIKHGYQVGAEAIDWFLSRFITGETHDPKQVFLDSRDAFNRGDFPVLSLLDSYFGGSGHAVRPYKWDDSDPNNWVISIANPNNPAPGFSDAADPCFILIDPNNNTFTFRISGSDTWSGGSWTGGRMLYLPFRHLVNQPRTPFWEILALLLSGVIIIVGDSGQTQQISDDGGRTLFEPGLGTPPTRWDHFRQDTSTRVPNLTRVALTNGPGPIGGTGPSPIEMYYGRSPGASYTHSVVPAAGMPAGTPYEWVMHTPTLSAQVIVPGTPGVPDSMTASALYAPNKGVTVAPGGNKSITWTMAGPVKQRWFELSNLNLEAGQALTTKLANSGFAFTFNNTGSETSANLRVKAGPTATPVVVGQITIPSGDSGPSRLTRPKPR